MTSKGQVTIPIEIRQRFGIRATSEVEFEIVDGEVCLRVVRAPGSNGRGLVESLRGKATAARP